MANDLNDCKFTGRLGADPEIKFLADGKEVVNFNIAVGSSWTDKATHEKKERVEWVRCVVFGGLASVCGKYLKKGSFVLIGGRLQTRKWNDKDGTDKYTTEVVIDGFNGVMQMLGNKSESGGQGYQKQDNYSQEPEGDIPF